MTTIIEATDKTIAKLRAVTEARDAADSAWKEGILEAYASGLSVLKISQEAGTTRVTVQRIIDGRKTRKAAMEDAIGTMMSMDIGPATFTQLNQALASGDMAAMARRLVLAGKNLPPQHSISPEESHAISAGMEAAHHVIANPGSLKAAPQEPGDS